MMLRAVISVKTWGTSVRTVCCDWLEVRIEDWFGCVWFCCWGFVSRCLLFCLERRCVWDWSRLVEVGGVHGEVVRVWLSSRDGW